VQGRSYILTALAALILAIAYLSVPVLHVPLHFALAQLCHGVSAGKIIFLLGFAIASMVRLAIATRSSTVPVARTLRAFWFALGIGLVGAIGSYAFYVTRLNLPVDAPTLHWLHGRNSINSIVHTHTSKAIIALSIDWLGLGHLKNNFDTGAPYAPFVPTWLSVLIGVCFLTSITSFLRALPSLVARYPANQRFGVACTATLAGCAATKCILDGGPLAYDAVCGMLTLIGLTQAFSLRDLAGFSRRHALNFITIVTIWLIIVGITSFGALPNQAEHFAYRLTIHSLILFAAAWSVVPRSSFARQLLPSPGLATLALSLCVLAFAMHQARTWLLPMYRPAPSFAMQYNESMEKAQPVRTTASSIEGAYRALGNSPTRVRTISFPEPVAGPGTGFYGQLVPLHQGLPIRLLPQLSASLVRIARQEPALDGPLGAFNVQVEFPGPFAPAISPPTDRPMTALDENERYVAFHLLDRALQRAGLDEYVLIPYVLYSDRKTALTRPATPAGVGINP